MKTYTTYTYNSTEAFKLPFPTLKPKDITVWVDGTKQENVVIEEGKLSLSEVNEGSLVEVQRHTPLESLLPTREGEAISINSDILSKLFRALLYKSQEVDDTLERVLHLTPQGIDVQGKRLRNSGDPQDDKDVVTVQWVKALLDERTQDLKTLFEQMKEAQTQAEQKMQTSQMQAQEKWQNLHQTMESTHTQAQELYHNLQILGKDIEKTALENVNTMESAKAEVRQYIDGQRGAMEKMLDRLVTLSVDTIKDTSIKASEASRDLERMQSLVGQLQGAFQEYYQNLTTTHSLAYTDLGQHHGALMLDTDTRMDTTKQFLQTLWNQVQNYDGELAGKIQKVYEYGQEVDNNITLWRNVAAEETSLFAEKVDDAHQGIETVSRNATDTLMTKSKEVASEIETIAETAIETVTARSQESKIHIEEVAETSTQQLQNTVAEEREVLQKTTLEKEEALQKMMAETLQTVTGVKEGALEKIQSLLTETETQTQQKREEFSQWAQEMVHNVTETVTDKLNAFETYGIKLDDKVTGALEALSNAKSNTETTIQEMLKIHEEALTLQKNTLHQQSEALFKDMKETAEKTLQATREDIKQLGQEAQKYLELAASGYGAHEAQLSIAAEKVQKQIASLGSELTTALTEIKTDFDIRYYDDKDIYEKDLKRFKEEYAEKVADISKKAGRMEELYGQAKTELEGFKTHYDTVKQELKDMASNYSKLHYEHETLKQEHETLKKTDL